MTISVLTQAELSTRLGGDDQLAILASPIAELDTEAEATIADALADVSSEIEAALAGVSIDYTTIPDALKAIGATLAKGRLYEMVWSLIPEATLKEMEKARARLAAFAGGVGSVNGATPAQQVAGSFSWQDVGNSPSTSNPRTTVAARMRRLP